MANKSTKAVRKKAAPEKIESERKLREPRSPKTNLVWALIISLALFLFTSDTRYALSAGIFAFLFFNTVDYMIFYYRYKKGDL